MDSTVGEAPVAAPTPRTAGAWLRQVRQAQGMHIAMLAATLKVPQAKLDALENDRYQDLPDPTFIRALALAMCRALKVDPATALALLPRVQDPELERVSRGLNQPFRERATRDEALSLDLLKRPVLWVPLLLLAAAAAVYLLPANWLDQFTKPSAAASEQIVQPEAPASAPSLVAEPASAIPQPQQQNLAASEPAPQPKLEAVVAAPVAQASVPQAKVAAAGQAPLVIKASADSWVEVTDAQGQVLLSKLLRRDEVAELAVQTPVKLRIGNVAGTSVSLRGSAVNLAAQASNNVARLELN
ncbi:helix-turn-helix domain-containing protein [Pelomonas sp. V22]|uniref:helix-turn-helix domain-containing protein n=1 Tax=Pelomonas sp. V22 TaxID=2822139 RepID=UPI0024A88823|nr:helix-turn-helix domain-containing protein [Pelomonas sp. V22]MDI4632341.1 helix-turn-helix domain-containing protein [Pelomonas sp. V22]